MNKKRIFEGLPVMALLIFIVGTAGAELINGGFEETRTVLEKDPIIKTMQTRNWKFDEPLLFPSGWKVNPNTKDGEYRLIKDAGQSHGGNNSIYIKGHFTIDKTIPVTKGDEIELSFYVKDPEQKNVVIYFYCYGKNDEGRTMNIGALNFTAQATAEWSKKTWKLTVPENIKDNKLYQVIVALSSVTGAYFDDVEMTHKKAE